MIYMIHVIVHPIQALTPRVHVASGPLDIGRVERETLLVPPPNLSRHPWTRYQGSIVAHLTWLAWRIKAINLATYSHWELIRYSRERSSPMRCRP